ncbi:magnesium transport protein transmembrane region [Neofusicoccum parvum]|uniref:Magnesium transport protein transmembrane region n=1 Tax=Neofusicoccum parvum TaxID=310453 RepID=A0ACB5RY47_9PEZI|nr:magnesium transport protein transmembrane region [Neofusicoccum parvum]
MTHEMERLTDMRRKDNTDTLDIERRIGLRHTRTIDNDFLKHSENAMRDNLELLTMVTNHKADAEMVAKSFMDAIFRSIDLLYTLMGQRDSRLNLAMAHDSRRLANASKRDSSSMKTIAVLTTVFLPGTFIATVFGMNMVKLSPAEFWVYLAITIPLTVVVLVIWAMWMLWINYQNEKEDERAQEQLPFENPFERPAKDSKRERATLPVVMKVFCQA